MATFVVGRDVDAPALDVWRTVTDWPAHGRWVPLTTVRLTRRTSGEGTRFVGRTGIGRLGFDDPMEVVRWQPPDGDAEGVATVRKQGRLVLGWAEVRVQPLGPGRSRVVWTEDVEIAPAAWTGGLAPVVHALGRLAFGHLLRQAAREAVRGRRG